MMVISKTDLDGRGRVSSRVRVCLFFGTLGLVQLHHVSFKLVELESGRRRTTIEIVVACVSHSSLHSQRSQLTNASKPVVDKNVNGAARCIEAAGRWLKQSVKITMPSASRHRSRN